MRNTLTKWIVIANSEQKTEVGKKGGETMISLFKKKRKDKTPEWKMRYLQYTLGFSEAHALAVFKVCEFYDQCKTQEEKDLVCAISNAVCKDVVCTATEEQYEEGWKWKEYWEKEGLF